MEQGKGGGRAIIRVMVIHFLVALIKARLTPATALLPQMLLAG